MNKQSYPCSSAYLSLLRQLQNFVSSDLPMWRNHWNLHHPPNNSDIQNKIIPRNMILKERKRNNS